MAVYRCHICGSGNCPVGIATQNPELRARLNKEAVAQRVFSVKGCVLST